MTVLRRNALFGHAFLTLTIAILLTSSSSAATERVLKALYPKDGVAPLGGVVFDAVGNLYGTCFSGGVFGFGTAFILRPNPTGPWGESEIYVFGDIIDGRNPVGNLIIDDTGSLYGTTTNSTGSRLDGVVFQLSPSEHGYWNETLLHTFAGVDGDIPHGVVRDSEGNLFGTTGYGGAFNYGVFFELSPLPAGGWTYTRWYSFGNGQQDAAGPLGSLVRDNAGNFYGESGGGGKYIKGTVFELSPQLGGGWTETILHEFGGIDGSYPESGLAIDASGNLYGTTSGGGVADYGVAFKLSHNAGGGWSEQVIHSFGSSTYDGLYPAAAVALDADGNVFGTTYEGGNANLGTVFELSPSPGDRWTGKILHHFTGNLDGAYPTSDLTWDNAGNLYGTTQAGGGSGVGVVYEITP